MLEVGAASRVPGGGSMNDEQPLGLCEALAVVILIGFCVWLTA